LFAVACAGMFPLLHLGRPWLFYWLFPYPKHHGGAAEFPQPAGVGRVRGFDVRHGVAAVLVRGPDARPGDAARPHPEPPGAGGVRVMAMGCAVRPRHWSVYETATLLLAGLATPLVLSVHTVVSFDFTIAHRAGVAQHVLPAVFRGGRHLLRFCDGVGAGHSAARRLRLAGMITDKHLDNCAKVMLATGLIVAYAYILETFTAWYSGNVYEQAGFLASHDRPLRSFVLATGQLQHSGTAGAVVQAGPQQPRAAVLLLAGGAGGHVAGAVT